MAVCNYQVFLSFRGPDTRKGLVDYLYNRLRDSGIGAFLDREEIEYGKSIGTTIVKAIDLSDICVPVFSQGFASSPACLMEVAQMVESQKKILPIFFFIEPRDVRYQRETYEVSFAKHESKKRYPESTIKKWRKALRDIADLKGLEFKKAALGEIGGTNGTECEAFFSGFRELEDFISKLWVLLKMGKQEVTKNLVGIERDVSEMMQKLGFAYHDGRAVEGQERPGRMVFVVWGVARVGKTTLAKVVYNEIRHLFQGCSFLRDVREKKVVYLQNKLIHDLKGGGRLKVNYSDEGVKKIAHIFQQTRVLIVLDNVDDLEQIKPLANKVTWFGPGSIIILTSRRKDIIEHYSVPVREHQVSSMDENHALELFQKHAIKPGDIPQEEYDVLSRKITSAAGHLPYYIEILGRYLRNKDKKIWDEAPGNVIGELSNRVKPILKQNYESLSKNSQEIFLDIACFFIEVEKRNPYYMWVAQGLCPATGLCDLQNISFLKIGEEEEFLMYNPVKIFGTETVKDNCIDPGKCSRLWDYKDVQTTLQEMKYWQDTRDVNALRIPPDCNRDSNFNCLHWKDFRYLQKLRFLDLDSVDIKGNSEDNDADIKGNSEDNDADIKGNSDDVLPNLVWLDWHGCSQKSQLFALTMEKLVILDLSSSQVSLRLEEWETLMRKAKHLKVMNVKDCPLIHASLEFPYRVPLERLILEGSLLVNSTNRGSTSGLVNLVTLNMNRCKYFKYVPPQVCSLTALKELLIEETNIEKLNFVKNSLPALEILSACKCKNLIDVDSITFLKHLRKLTLRSCENLKKLPSGIEELDRLQEMDLSHTLIGELPLSFKKLKNLEVLKMGRTPLRRFPEAIKDLQKLKELDFTSCECLEGHCNITGLFSLKILKLKCTKIFQMPPGRFRLHILELGDCVPGQMAL